jgi:hypothetical protein
LNRAIYLAFVIFFLFIGIVIYNKSIQKEQESKTVAPCEDAKTFQEIKQNTDRLDNLILEKCK